MKKTILTSILVLFGLILFAQTTESTSNGYSNFSEFQKNEPTLTFEFQLKQRTTGDIFMTGGIANYRLKKIIPSSETDNVEKIIWGVRVGDSTYINSYPITRKKGYNLIIEKGYYSYFIGEPAFYEKEQRKLGIIKPEEKQVPVCCQVGYVILPDGVVKFLKPELLLELCKDDKEIASQIKWGDLKPEDVNRMFDFLKKYNLTKKFQTANTRL